MRLLDPGITAITFLTYSAEPKSLHYITYPGVLRLLSEFGYLAQRNTHIHFNRLVHPT